MRLIKRKEWNYLNQPERVKYLSDMHEEGYTWMDLPTYLQSWFIWIKNKRYKKYYLLQEKKWHNVSIPTK